MTAKEDFLRKFNEAFAKGDTDFLIAHVTNDIEWTVYGDKTISGIQDFKKAVEKMKSEAKVVLKLDQIITHGKTAAVNGTIKMTGNGKTSTYAFADVCILSGFKNPKVKQMKSYVIKIENDEK